MTSLGDSGRSLSQPESRLDRPLAILSAPGSRGDLNPLLSIGVELRRRGFDVAISLVESYAAIARDAGLDPYPLVSRQEFEDVLADPAIWKIVPGILKVLRGVASQFTERHFELVRRLYRPRRTVLISHPLDFASRILRDLEPDLPLVDVHLAPMLLRTKQQPPVLTPWNFSPGRLGATFDLTYWLADKLVVDPILGSTINRIRKRCGLGPVRRVMHRWCLSPDLILAMYPEWFAPATDGFLPQLRHVGFPLDDASTEHLDVPHDSPIVFTGGTANRHAKDLFRRAAEACDSLRIGGILLTTHQVSVPMSLPPTVRHMGYVPLGKLLPHCRAIVHHGGIGTTSQALRAGIPQLVRPMAFDQFDNAARVQRLGVGRVLRKDAEMVSLLESMLGDETATTAREVAQRFGMKSAAVSAADAVERVAQNLWSSSRPKPQS